MRTPLSLLLFPALLAAQTPQEDLSALEREIKEVRTLARAASPGTTRFLVTGYASAGYKQTSGHEAEPSTFTAGFNPIFLWKIGDRLFMEGELEVEPEGHGTEVDLEYAALSYILGDHAVLRMGKFLTPFGLFPERLHPAWINKLPDKPLPFGGAGHGGGLVPISSLGLELRGGAGPLNFAFYAANGPRLNTGEEEPEEAGLLHFDNQEDQNRNKALGGRLGLLAWPSLEVGFSFLQGRVGPDRTPFEDVKARLHGADLSFVDTFSWGTVDLRAEWIRSKVDPANYGMDMEPFDNTRTGAYAQAAFRPSAFHHLEFVARWDKLDLPHDERQRRWTYGLNWWVSPSAAFKTAVQTLREEGREAERTFRFQFALGF